MHLIGHSSLLAPFVENPQGFLGQEVNFKGTLYRKKDLGKFAFLHVATYRSIIQCIYTGDASFLHEGSSLEISGLVKKSQIKDPFLFPRNLEIEIKKLEVLSAVTETMPFDLTKKDLEVGNDSKFDLRMLSMRHPKERAIFKIQEGIALGLREYFSQNGLTEIRTPKIVKEGAEGGANIFEINYFGTPAYLTQSPQFYKEFCTGVFQRVFEIAPVFRAEKHNTSRHINEYTSVDVEIGLIESFHDIMSFEVGALKNCMNYLKQHYAYELAILEVTLPEVQEVPALKFSEAKEILASVFSIDEKEEPDLSPEEERKISEYMKTQTGSDFVFITHYPSVKRPFYAKDDPQNPAETLSFDLIFRGIEITTGGQRIHEYQELVNKMKARGMNPVKFEFFSVAHKYGLPPHGGFGLGLERLTQKILGLESVKLATMFPRDIGRLSP